MTLTLSGSNGLSDVDGSAATPAFRGTDANTGMFFPAADTIAFAEGGTEVMRIDSSGNVGIGTSSPADPLNIYNSSPYIRLTDADLSTRLARIGGENGNVTIDIDPNATAAASFFSVAIDNTERVRIDSSGQVGIGTTSPTQKLDVSGNIAFSGNGRRIIGDFSTSTQTNRLIFQSSVTDGFTNIGAAPNGAGTGSALRFYSTSDPDNSSVATIISGGGTNTVSLQSSITGTGTYIPLTFFTNGSERMRIETGGEVYIAGTTDRGAYNLQCNGTGVWGAGAYVNGSDARIKEEVSSLSSGLDVVTKLNPVQFRYKSDWSKDTSLQPGFIAQELKIALADQPYVDGVVQEGPQYMSVAYQTLIPVLVKALQELKDQNDELKARVEALENPTVNAIP